MNYELKQYSFGETIGKGFNLYFNNFIPIVLVSLLCQIPSVLIIRFTNILTIAQNPYLVNASFFINLLIVIVLEIIMGAFLSALIIHFVSKKFLESNPLGRENNPASILPLIIPVIGLSLLSGIIIALSMIALVIPGIIVALGFSVATQVLVIEKRKIMASLKRSWDLTKRKKWSIFWIVVVAAIITYLINQPFLLILKWLSLDTIVITYLNYAITAITSPIQACIMVVVYFNIRIEKEGFNIEHLAGQFTLAENSEPSAEA